MKTTHYNPSPIEVTFAKVITELKDEIQKRVPDFKIAGMENNSQIDNPHLLFTLVDPDGDVHRLMIQFIQRADE